MKWFERSRSAGVLAVDHLCGDKCGVGSLVVPDLQFPVHLTPDTRIAPAHLATVVAARTLKRD